MNDGIVGFYDDYKIEAPAVTGWGDIDMLGQLIGTTPEAQEELEQFLAEFEK